MQYDAIILDVDGTLWDSRALVADAWNQGVQDLLGYDPHYTASDMDRLFGNTMVRIGELLFPELAPERRNEIMYRLINDYENQWLTRAGGTFYPGVPETIPALARRVPVYILSNCQKGYIEWVMHYGGFRESIRDWMCFEDTGRGKGENLRLLCQRHDLRCPVYVGDTAGDWQACQQAGIPMIFAAYGLGRVEGLPTIHAFYELEQLLDEA